ncbi:hypothetical protein TSAR_001628, partial [Trichomalopsis sarcophagae]
KEKINKNSINIYRNKSSFATRRFLRSQNTNIVDDKALLGTWCPGWTPKLVIREFLRSQKTNIVTSTLLEHGYGAILKIIPRDDVDTVYPGHQVPTKPLSSLYSYSVTSKTPNQRVSTKNVTTLILHTLGTRYLGERCRRYSRVHQPRKPPNTSESIAVAIFVFSDPKTPLVTKLYFLSSILSAFALQQYYLHLRLPKEKINKNSINIYRNKSSFATRRFLRSQNTNIVDDKALLGTWCPGWTPKLVIREFLRSQKTNIVTSTLLEVPSAQGE